jgi:hypothetical protein
MADNDEVLLGRINAAVADHNAAKKAVTSAQSTHRLGGPAVRPEIALIKKRGPNPVMSKRIFVNEQGKVCSDGSQCLMAQGTATRHG